MPSLASDYNPHYVNLHDFAALQSLKSCPDLNGKKGRVHTVQVGEQTFVEDKDTGVATEVKNVRLGLTIEDKNGVAKEIAVKPENLVKRPNYYTTGLISDLIQGRYLCLFKEFKTHEVVYPTRPDAFPFEVRQCPTVTLCIKDDDKNGNGKVQQVVCSKGVGVFNNLKQEIK